MNIFDNFFFFKVCSIKRPAGQIYVHVYMRQGQKGLLSKFKERGRGRESNSLSLQLMWLTVCGWGGNCWSMPVVTRAFTGADVRQTESGARREPRWAQNWWLIPYTAFTPICLPVLSAARRGALTDRELSPSDLAVLKDCGSSDLGTKQLSSIPQVHSPCKTTPQSWHVFTVSLQNPHFNANTSAQFADTLLHSF